MHSQKWPRNTKHFTRPDDICDHSERKFLDKLTIHDVSQNGWFYFFVNDSLLTVYSEGYFANLKKNPIFIDINFYHFLRFERKN